MRNPDRRRDVVDLRELAARIERLERENRRLKLAGGAVVAVLLAVALVGAVLPQDELVVDAWIVRTQHLQIVDDTGRTVANLARTAGGDKAVLQLLDPETGNIQTNYGWWGIDIFDPKIRGRSYLSLRADHIQLFQSLYGDELTAGIYGGFGGGGRIVLAGADGDEISIETSTYKSGQKPRITLLDAEGNVIWQAPR